MPTKTLLAKDSMFGLHPEFEPVLSMWNDGRFGAVQAVGMPAPNRSHFAAMEAVEDADPGRAARIGWLNRMIGLTPEDAPQEGMQLGSTMLPTSLVGPAEAISARQLADFRLPGGEDKQAQARMRSALTALWEAGHRDRQGGEGGARRLRDDDLTGQGRQAGQWGQVSRRRSRAGAGRRCAGDQGWGRCPGDHPGLRRLGYARDLGTVAGGNMKNHVGGVAKAIAAFFTDLGSSGDQVTLGPCRSSVAESRRTAAAPTTGTATRCCSSAAAYAAERCTAAGPD